MSKSSFTNNIAFLRRSALKTAEQAGREIGVTKSQWTKYENEVHDWRPMRKEIAKVVNAKPKDLDDPKLRDIAVPVTCWVKNKSYVYPDPPLKLLDKVKPFAGAPRSTQACFVRNPDHPAYPEPTILYFDSNPTTTASKIVGRECLVTIEKTTRGNRMLAWVERGETPGRYTLFVHKQPVAFDVKIISANPILKAIRP